MKKIRFEQTFGRMLVFIANKNEKYDEISLHES